MDLIDNLCLYWHIVPSPTPGFVPNILSCPTFPPTVDFSSSPDDITQCNSCPNALPDVADADIKVQYQRLVLCTRPDIAYVAMALSQYCYNFTPIWRIPITHQPYADWWLMTSWILFLLIQLWIPLCWLIPDCGSLSLIHHWLRNLIYYMDLILLVNTLGLCTIPNSI